MTSWRQYVQRATSFFDSIDARSRVALVFDSDPDGISSAVLVAHTLKARRGVKPFLAIPSGHNVQMFDDAVLADFVKKKITHLIVTDLSLDQRLDFVRALEKHARILILDHHKLYRDVGSNRTLLIKPQLFQKKIDPSQYCSSKLAYDLCLELSDIKGFDWLAVIGILADSNFRTWKPFVRKTMKRLGLPLDDAHPFDNPLGRMCNLMAYYEIYAPGKVGRLYDAVQKASTYKRALNSEIRKSEKVNTEVEHYLKNYERYTERHDDLFLIRIKPKYRVGSIIATRLSNHLPHTTIVVATEMGGRMFVSARRQDFKVAVNDLLEESVKEMKEASAGGHIPAAGARFPTQQYATFSQRIILQTSKKK